MKIGIVIIVFNLDCRVFILQMEAIKKFCKDENYTIEIFNNSDDKEKRDAIEHHAKVQEVNHRVIESGTKDGSLSHSFAANFAFMRLKDMYNALLFLDHDAIPVLPFSVENILNGKVVGGMLSGRNLNYFWAGCFAINLDKVDKDLVDFSPNNELLLDTGGELRKLKDKYGDEGCVYFDEVGVQNPYQINHKEYYFYTMIYNKTFLHFINASDWRKVQNNDERISSLIAITSEKINNYSE